MRASEAIGLLDGAGRDGRPCGLTVRVEHTNIETEALSALRGEGWACFASAVDIFVGGPVPNGLLLRAEARVDAATSVQVRHDGRAWTIVTLTETEGDSHIGIDQAFGTNAQGAKASDRLRYRVYWALSAEPEATGGLPVWRPCAARLLGVQQEGEA